MIEVRGLVKSFEGFNALDGVDLTAGKGAIYGLVGPNGCGKTTLIRHLAGVYRQDSGEARIDGLPVYENPAVKQRIAYIPDDLYFFPQATIADMRHFYSEVYPNFSDERYEKLKDIFPINEKKQIRRLSKGMQKQVAFWLSICMMPDLLLLDEPVDGLDPVMRRQVWSILVGDVSERGTTVLVSSHNLRELEDVCDHVGIMHKGKVILERSLEELQGNIVKMQLAFDGEMPKLPDDMEVMHIDRIGRVYFLIMRGTPEETTAKLLHLNPVLIEALPLTLEEIFIYELGGMEYAIKDILL